MSEINVSRELKRVLRLRGDKVMLDDIITNFDEWMGVIAGIESMAEADNVKQTLEPAFKTIYGWRNDPVMYNYLKDRINYVQRLKSAFDSKMDIINSGRRRGQEVVYKPLPKIAPSETRQIIDQRPRVVKQVEEPIKVRGIDKQKKTEEKKPSGWGYQPTLSDLLDYYQYKGVVGEESVCILQTLGAINKLCFGLESLSGSGKSYVVQPLLELLPKEDVYKMELSSKTAEMYEADRINRCQIIYIPELQKAMQSNNQIIVEVLKGLTEGKDVSRKVRDQAERKTKQYVIKGDKGIIFTLAVENVFKYDAEFSRRVFILHTDVSEEQTDKILRYKASKRHAVGSNEFGVDDFERIADHVRDCLYFQNASYENPFAEFIAEQVPRTIRARSYDDYLFDLMDACAKFHFKNRVISNNILFLNLEDVYDVIKLYWKQFCKGLLKIPVLGEEVMGLFDLQDSLDEKIYSAQDVYLMIKDENPGYTFKMVENTLEALVDSGFLVKDDYKSTRPRYSKINEINGFDQSIDWEQCWKYGLEFMTNNYPELVDGWLLRQVVEGDVVVLDHVNGEKIKIVEHYKTDEVSEDGEEHANPVG